MSLESPKNMDVLDSQDQQTAKANLAWEVIRNIGELGDTAKLKKMHEALERLNQAI